MVLISVKMLKVEWFMRIVRILDTAFISSNAELVHPSQKNDVLLERILPSLEKPILKFLRVR